VKIASKIEGKLSNNEDLSSWSCVSITYMAFPVAPERIWQLRAPARSKIGGLSCPYNFLALKAQLVVLVSAIVMVSTVSSFLFFYSRYSPCPVICKSGGTCPPPFPMESAPLGVPFQVYTTLTLNVTCTLTLTVTLTVTQYLKISLYCWWCTAGGNNVMLIHLPQRKVTMRIRLLCVNTVTGMAVV